jgi:polyvinyl alcohol dehydrogenase (cytochrome)
MVPTVELSAVRKWFHERLTASRRRVAAGGLTLIVVGAVSHGQAQNRADNRFGQDAYQKACAKCHDNSASHAPPLASLRGRTPESILNVMISGSMRYQSLHLSGAERRAIAEYVTGKPFGTDMTGASIGQCSATVPFDFAKEPSWNGWSPTTANTHFQSTEQAGLTASQVAHLELKWAFGFPDAAAAWSQPTVVGGRVFVGSQNGTVYSLDAKSGCIVWTFTAKGGVRTAITVAPRAAGYGAYFSDISGNVYGVDALSGKPIWSVNVESSPFVRGTGTPVLYQGVLYVPMSGFEEIQASDPDYECCTFRGSITAVDAAAGSIRWKTYMVHDPPKIIGRKSTGAKLWGPSGVGIWAAPTIDPKRGVIYVATGNSTSGPPQETSDAIIALELKTGRMVWSTQVTSGDTWVFGCEQNRSNENCPHEVGPDDDFGAPVILAKLPNGNDALIADQKSGVGYALDPDDRGRIIWRYRFGQTKTTGSAQWGAAVDSENAYFAVSDLNTPQPGGLHAVSLATGERVWYTPPAKPICGTQPGCNPAQFAPITVIPGVVFSGSNDGGLRAYSTRDGSIIWEFDANREFKTVNGVPARGATFNAAGPTLVDGMLFVNSGYGFLGGRPGNVLLAFGLK